jgi:nucleotide-binding universal stress UspA family protein
MASGDIAADPTAVVREPHPLAPDKGLKKGALGFISSVVIGVASTAPGYSLAASLGVVAASAALFSPGVMWVAFLPMFFIAGSYYAMNRVALAAATELAKELRANVVVVFGYYVTPLGGGGGEDVRTALERVGSHALQRAVADLDAAGVPVESRLVAHKPAEAIIDVADEVDARLIVVGTAGEHPITGALLGSVVLRLVQRSSRPLLVVPAS